MGLELFAIFVYIVIQCCIGQYVSKRIKNVSDYFLAGRQGGVFLVTMSAFATWFGAETCIGSAGAIYASGISGGRVDPLGYTCCLLLFATFLASKFWNEDITTIGDLYRKKFSVEIETLAAIIIIPSSIFWASAQVRALGQILTSVTPFFSLNVAIAVASLVVVFYTTLGGILADAYTDVFQGGILMTGLILMLVIVMYKIGSPVEALLSVEPARLNPFHIDESPLVQIDRWMVPILGSLVAQELVAKICVAKNATTARRGAYYAAFVYLFIGSIPVFFGLIGPKIMPHLAESEQLLPLLAKHYLHPVFYLMFAGALVSAILSTIDSALLASGALFFQNVLPRFYPHIPQDKRVKYARLSVGVSGIVAFCLATQATRIYDLIEYASSMGSSGILVTTLLALFTNFGDKWSAGFSLVGGFVSLFIAKKLGMDAPYIASIFTALALYVIVALRSHPKKAVMALTNLFR